MGTNFTYQNKKEVNISMWFVSHSRNSNSDCLAGLDALPHRLVAKLLHDLPKLLGRLAAGGQTKNAERA
jgi:hypothetical protein